MAIFVNTLVVHKPVFKKSHSITFVKIQSLILVACLSPHSSLMIKSCWQIKKPNKIRFWNTKVYTSIMKIEKKLILVHVFVALNFSWLFRFANPELNVLSERCCLFFKHNTCLGIKLRRILIRVSRHFTKL